MSIKPDYANLGFTSPMGPQLRALVVEHLLADLQHYMNVDFEIKFDWSQTCIEGRDSVYLDGYLDNFSTIRLFDSNDNFIAEGWMDFVHELGFVIVFWDHLEFAKPGSPAGKPEFGIPPHIWEKIPNEFKHNYKKDRMKEDN